MAKKNQEVEIETGKLNQKVRRETIRPNGTRRIVFDYQYCTSMTEQHGRWATDINYLMKKFQPDELAAYIAARNTHRMPITGHDFSAEPSYQDAKNHVLEMQKSYENLPEEVKKLFPKLVDFLKFLDSEKNIEKFEKLGLLSKEELEKLKVTRLDQQKQKQKLQDEEDERIIKKLRESQQTDDKK